MTAEKDSAPAAPDDGNGTRLVRSDLVVHDDVLLPAFDGSLARSASSGTSDSAGSALQVADLLDAGNVGNAGLSADGGFLMFDDQSNPGSTIVHVMIEDASHHQLIEVGVFQGSGMDLNSLLGLIAPDGGQS